MPKYVCKRKDVCLGKLINKMDPNTLCRGMVFTKFNNRASDLIYTTPNDYPIEDQEEDFLISEYVELEELLDYLEYDEDLTQHDLNTFFKKVVTNPKWIKRNYQLFKNVIEDFDGKIARGEEVALSANILSILREISYSKKTKPVSEEPGYKLIKKIK